MKKLIGFEAEFNITSDDDICKGLGKGLSNGSILIRDIIKEVKPEIIKAVKKLFNEDKVKGKKNEKHNSNR